MQARQYSLVADIGGTNARFALVDDSKPGLIEKRSLRVADYPSIVYAVQAYLEQVGPINPYQAVMSVAAPVTGDLLNMTNHTWNFSIHETRETLALRHLKVINDYTALALALPLLTENQLRMIGPGAGQAGRPVAVLGPGTGLGVSGAFPVGNRWVPLEGEGGHVSYGPLDAREQEIIEVLREKMEHVSAESLVSGPGLSAIYAALDRLDGGSAQKLSPGEVTDLALDDDSAMANEALSVFCGILGSVAGNLALTLGATGGVYIGGGIVPKVLDFFSASAFRERFEQHGRMRLYLRNIPTYVITASYPALRGAAVALNAAYANVGVSSYDAAGSD
ncbi:MAG: glucokinase [Gammaproteobacteria bacterium]|nr:glucokinase [Gammaproteobacteria bacterium]MDH3535758.1 glucokinase [Gammaproteobacteria bacterium]